jgi:hypothetical protein
MFVKASAVWGLSSLQWSILASADKNGNEFIKVEVSVEELLLLFLVFYEKYCFQQ